MKNNASNAKIAIAALGAAIVCAFCLFRSACIEAVYPVERAKKSFVSRVASRFEGMWRGAAAEAENVRLRRELAALAMARGEFFRLEAENERLRAALDYTARTRGSWKLASVLSEGGGAAGTRRTLRIDKGTLAGVRKGAVVAVPEGLVGRVVEATPHTAEVLTIVDPSLNVACIVEGERGTRAILSGGTDDLLAMRFFSAGAGVTPGARVFTSGLGGVFPSGLEIGRVRAVTMREGGEGVRECEVEPMVDFAAIEDVFVVVEPRD